MVQKRMYAGAGAILAGASYNLMVYIIMSSICMSFIHPFWCHALNTPIKLAHPSYDINKTDQGLGYKTKTKVYYIQVL